MLLASPASEAWLADASSLFQLYAIPFLWRVLGAIAVWIVGGVLIRIACRMLATVMQSRDLDRTLTTYVTSLLDNLLRLVLIVGLLGMFGVESASFAALLAAVGIAIGMAWSGLLSNFAAGVFLVLLRPFKVGQAINAAGVAGLVQEMGLFATAIDTRDNIRVFVGNSKLLSDNIMNYSHNAYSRTEVRAQIAHGVDPFEVAARIGEQVVKLPHVLSEPAPEVGILEYNAAGALLFIRPYVRGGAIELESVAAGAYRIIAQVTAGLPIPAVHQMHTTVR